MLRLIGIFIIIIIILAGIDYMITSSVAHTSIVTITNKYMENNVYFVETISLDKFKTSNDLYYKLDSGSTYKVKVFNDEIVEIINMIN